MTCPACFEKKTRVVETRCFRGIDVDRRHECACGVRWSSTERLNRGSVVATRINTTTTGSTPAERRQTTDSMPADRETVSVSPAPPLIRSVSESLPGIHGNPDPNQTRVGGFGSMVLMQFPCDGDTQNFVVTEAMRQKHAVAFPSLDVGAEYAQALAWIEANPTRRKTARGMPAFLVSWLSRSQNSGRGMARPIVTPARNFTQEANDQVRLQYLQRVAAMEGK